ncbi:hypothetical protein VTH06DRAFT_7168 [Thermothelomyces fergusii]
MSKPANKSAISTPAVSAKASESDAHNNQDDHMPPSPWRASYKPAVPWAFTPPTPAPTQHLPSFLDDDDDDDDDDNEKRRPKKEASLAVRMVRSHFLVKVPAVVAVALALSCRAPPAPTPLLRNLLRAAAAAVALQAAVAAPSALLGTGLLADLAGSVGLVAAVAAALGDTAAANRATAGVGVGVGVGVVGWADAVVEGAVAIGRALDPRDGRVWDEVGVDWRQGWVSTLVCVWALKRRLYSMIPRRYCSAAGRMHNR